MYELCKALDDAVWALARSGLRPLERRAADVRSYFWEHLTNTAKELLECSDGLFARVSVPSVRSSLQTGQQILRACVGRLRRVASACLVPACVKETASQNLKVVCGVPGVLGCMNMKGDAVFWQPLLHSRTGLAAAFDALDVDLAGLPAARLPSGTRLPKRLVRGTEGGTFVC